MKILIKIEINICCIIQSNTRSNINGKKKNNNKYNKNKIEYRNVINIIKNNCICLLYVFFFFTFDVNYIFYLMVNDFTYFIFFFLFFIFLIFLIFLIVD